MIDHIYLPLTDWSRSLSFYRALLPTIGIEEGRRLGDSAAPKRYAAAWTV
jgi:hypothetical protein